MTLLQILLLLGASILTGALNAVAGGGSFIAFPTLIFVGIPPVNANATNNSITWVGMLASTVAYRHELSIQRRELLTLCGTSFLGGIIGSVLLLVTPQTLFAKLIPYLLLIASVLFTFSQPLTTYLRTYSPNFLRSESFVKLSIPILQLVIATYGGYFGGGTGILILAMLSMMGMKNIHTMNGLKTLLGTCIDGIALIPFIRSGVIAWKVALFMSFGVILGGYWGVRYARKLAPNLVRRFVILVGFGMTLYFFLQA